MEDTISPSSHNIKSQSITLEDIKDSILWPLSFSVLIGLTARILIDKYKAYKLKPKTKVKGK